MQRVADFYADLEVRLVKATFVAGDSCSAADVTALATIDFATDGVQFGVPEAGAATRRWYDAVAARASVPARATSETKP